MKTQHVDGETHCHRWLLIRWHRNDYRDCVAIGTRNPTRVVEMMQARMKVNYGGDTDTRGRGFGCTWQVHDGDIVSALVAGERL